MSKHLSIEDINELEAHASALLKITARLKLNLGPVSTGAKQKKGGLSAKDKAKILFNREMSRNRKRA